MSCLRRSQCKYEKERHLALIAISLDQIQGLGDLPDEV